MLRRSSLVSLRPLCKVFALSVMMTFALASAAFAQLLPQSTLSIGDVTVTEGDTGTTNATFTVTRSGDTTLVSTVNFATANNTATQPSDYAATSGTLAYASGETTKTVTVSVNGDTTDETDETFFVDLSTPVDATISDNQGVGTITDDDDTPQANDDGSVSNPITLNEDDPNGVITNVLANDTGLGDTPIAVQVTTPPRKGAATVNEDNTITYRPSSDQNGSDTYIYTVTDSDGQASTATVYLQINPVNDAPVANNDSATIDEDTSAIIDVLNNDSDIDGDSLDVTSLTQPANGTVSKDSDGKVRYVPNNNFDGTNTFSYAISDGHGGSATANVTITVRPVNDAPVANNDSYSVDEDGTLTKNSFDGVLNNDSDVDGDSLTAALVNGPAHGTLNLSNDGSFSYTPAANYNGADSFSYKASDGTDGSNLATVGITVNAVNDAPSFQQGDDQTKDEEAGAQSVPGWATAISTGPANETGQAVSFIVSNNNNDLFTATGQPEVSSNGTLKYEPKANANGTSIVTAKAKDDGGTANGGADTSAEQTFTIIINPVNDAPSISKIADLTIDQDNNTGSIPFTIGDVDTSAAQLTLTRSSDNQDLVPDTGILFGGAGENQTIEITPANGQTGTAKITVTVSDGTAETVASFVLTVRDTTSPTSKSWAPKGKKVSPKAKPTVTFSEAMKPDTLVTNPADSSNPNVGTSTTFTLKKGTKKLSATVVYNPATKKVTLKPSRKLRSGARYTVTMLGGTNGAKDLAGNALATPKVWKFRVR